MDPSCRAKVLQQGSHHSESPLRLRRHMNEVLLDQLPVLADLKRVLEELALGCAGVPYAANSTLIIEQVSVRAYTATLKESKSALACCSFVQCGMPHLQGPLLRLQIVHDTLQTAAGQQVHLLCCW